MTLLQPVAIGIGKPVRRRPAPRRSAAAWPRACRGRAVARVSVRSFAPACRCAAGRLAAGCTSSLSEEKAARACGDLPRCAVRARAAVGGCVRGGNTTMAGRQSGKPSRQSRSFGCKWPSSMNLASSASEIGPNCWPSRARYHCVDEAGADMSVTGAGLLPAFEVECAGCDCALAWLEIRILVPLGVNRPGRQRLKPPVCGQAKAVCGPFYAPGGHRQGPFAPVVGSAVGKL